MEYKKKGAIFSNRKHKRGDVATYQGQWEAKGLFIDFVNGHKEHCHCLVSLGAEQTISKVMQLIKGESAFWFNKQGLINNKLEWQDEYFAISVSQSLLNQVREYIKNQEDHHKNKTFQQEYDEFILRHGFQKFKDL